MKNSLRRRLFDILLRMQSDGGRKHHTGDILNRIQEDVRVVSSTIAGSLPDLLGTSLQFLAALIFLLCLDIKLALAVVIVLPVGLFIGKYITGKIRHLTLLQTLEYAGNSSDELDSLQGNLYSSEIKRTIFSVISRIFIALAFQAGYVMAFMWGVFGISHGTVTYGMMTAFLQHYSKT